MKKILKKTIGVILITVSILLMCAVDTPCSTGEFILRLLAMPVLAIVGMILVAPKAVARFVLDIITDMNK
jgi:hypothetical protein